MIVEPHQNFPGKEFYLPLLRIVDTGRQQRQDLWLYILHQFGLKNDLCLFQASHYNSFVLQPSADAQAHFPFHQRQVHKLVQGLQNEIHGGRQILFSQENP